MITQNEGFVPLFKRVPLICCSLILTPAFASASDGDVVKQFGMVGEWAYDCSKPPSPDNQHGIYSIAPDGTVTVINKIGPNVPDEHLTATDFAVVSPNSFAVTLTNQTNSFVGRFVIARKDRWMLDVEAVNLATGETFVRNGVILRAGTPLNWIEKCSDAIS